MAVKSQFGDFPFNLLRILLKLKISRGRIKKLRVEENLSLVSQRHYSLAKYKCPGFDNVQVVIINVQCCSTGL